METRIETDDPREIEWRSLLTLTKHWKSDLQFFEDELRTLDTLNDRLYKVITRTANIEVNRKMAGDITKLQKKQIKLSKDVGTHLHHLTGMMQSPFALNYQAYREEHERLEVLFAQFVKAVRAVRRKVYVLIEEEIIFPLD